MPPALGLKMTVHVLKSVSFVAESLRERGMEVRLCQRVAGVSIDLIVMIHELRHDTRYR